MTESEIDALAETIWDYHHLHHALEPSDLLLALGSHDVRVAERAAELFLRGYAPLLVFSGGRGRLTEEWPETEARVFARIAEERGVPKDNILIEDGSTNTGENIKNTRALLQAYDIVPERILVVQKPYMERRAYATVKKQWPGVEVIVASHEISFQDYPNAEISKDEVISIMLGDLQRIPIYAECGFQIPQDVPQPVWAAYQRLVEAGYVSHLI